MFGQASKAAFVAGAMMLAACSPTEDEEGAETVGQDQGVQDQGVQDQGVQDQVVQDQGEDEQVENSLAPTIDPLFELEDETLPQATIETLPQVRQVIPGEGVTRPQAGDTVERLPSPPVPVIPPRPINLGIVVVEAANRLETRRGGVTLQGTRAVDEDATCQLADGRTPACHVLARSAVRRFIGTRSVSCVLGAREDTAQDHVAACTLGDSDIALWTVAQGWAFADANADATLRAAQTQARENERGLWASEGFAN